MIGALGPRGIVQGWLEPLGVERLPSIYGFGGAFVVLTLFTYPYLLLTVRAAYRQLDPSLEEASRTLGRNSLVDVRPGGRAAAGPAIAAGSLLVGAVRDLGLRRRVDAPLRHLHGAIYSSTEADSTAAPRR